MDRRMAAAVVTASSLVLICSRGAAQETAAVDVAVHRATAYVALFVARFSHVVRYWVEPRSGEVVRTEVIFSSPGTEESIGR